MQAFVSEGGLALERSRATIALADALERERLISHVSLELRSRRNVDEVLPAVLAEIGIVVDAARCFVRLGDQGDATAWRPSGTPTACRRSATRHGFRSSTSVRVCGAPLPWRMSSRRPRSRTAASASSVGSPSTVCTRCSRRRSSRRSGCSACSPSTARSSATGARRDRARRGRRAGGGGGARHVPAAPRERPPPGGAEGAAEGGRGADERSPLRRRDRAPRRGAPRPRQRRRGRLLDAAPRRLRARLPGRAGPPRGRGRADDPVAGTIGEAITTGKPVLASAATDFAEVMDAPISSFGEIRGVLGVCSREPGRFEESDLRLIEAFARLASIALRNAEAYEESTRQAQVERGFYRIAAVLERAAVGAGDARRRRAGGCRRARRRLCGRAPRRRSALELAGAARARGGARGAPPQERAVVAACARGGKVLASRRLRDDDRFGDGLGAAAAAAGRGSLLAVPLQQPRGEGAGLVLVFFQGERAFDDDQLELAEQVAAAARGALERSELYERERRVAPPGAAARPLRPRARGRARSGQRPRRICPPRRAAARAPTAPRCGCSKATRSSCARSPGRAGSTRSTRARRRPPGSWATSSRRARRGRSRMSPSIRGWARPTRCSPPATAATSACR